MKERVKKNKEESTSHGKIFTENFIGPSFSSNKQHVIHHLPKIFQRLYLKLGTKVCICVCHHIFDGVVIQPNRQNRNVERKMQDFVCSWFLESLKYSWRQEES